MFVRCTMIILAFLAAQLSAAEKTYELKSFDALESRGSIDFIITQGEKQSVVLTGSEKALEQVDVRVKNSGVLVVKQKSSGWFSDDDDNEVTAKLVVTDLRKITLSGSSDLTGKSLKLSNLALELSGSSEVKLTGSAKNLEIEVSGSSDVEAFDFLAERVKIEASGSSDIEVHATKMLETDISGSGEVEYLGSPAKVKTEVAGSASVTSKS